ncbi:unnamed protein product [Microthlaspi erraticum]|uniref:Pentacotripeptide-repeat region of PRORP domain-containing protein n=1 Tax=Microthlaspi erraticum TaxID=1685480 RepID=A0A6D2K3Z5_9BRAS|nr:unnamed protein product [Microthlaspi erraticum]
MEAEKLEPDVVIYSTVIDGLCKYKHPDDALDLFNEMEKKGIRPMLLPTIPDKLPFLVVKGVKPDVVTYNTMISGFCRKGLKEEASALFRKMKEDGPLPNSGTYNTLIRAYLEMVTKPHQQNSSTK